jgi:hypothetical protein
MATHVGKASTTCWKLRARFNSPDWPCSAGLNVGLYTLFGGLTFWLFYCPWFQDIVLGAKQRFERPIP